MKTIILLLCIGCLCSACRHRDVSSFPVRMDKTKPMQFDKNTSSRWDKAKNPR
ncbi:MAG: hypothetical protein WCI77_03990 [Candidatus Omnitrophota bacterium]